MERSEAGEGMGSVIAVRREQDVYGINLVAKVRKEVISSYTLFILLRDFNHSRFRSHCRSFLPLLPSRQ